MHGFLKMFADVRPYPSYYPTVWELFLIVQSDEYFLRRWDHEPSSKEVIEFITGQEA